MTVVSIHEAMPGFARPQESVEDLFTEYEAWVNGDLDGHDQVVKGFRETMLKRSEGAHEFALRFLDPVFVCSHGQCDCIEKQSVLRQLEGRLAVARGRRQAYESLERTIEKQIARYKGEPDAATAP